MKSPAERSVGEAIFSGTLPEPYYVKVENPTCSIKNKLIEEGMFHRNLSGRLFWF